MADISQIVLKDANGNVLGTYNVKDANVPHDSKTAASGGTTLSLVTTGEKYTWNNSPRMQTETYPVLLNTDGNSSWIKIGYSGNYYGLLPSTEGNLGNGHCYLGAQSWYWNTIFVDNVKCKSITTDTVNGAGIPLRISLGSIGANTTATYSISSDSIYSSSGQYLLTFASGYGVGGLYLLGINSQGSGGMKINPIVASSYLTITAVNWNSFSITTGAASFTPYLIQLAG
jgi:hypothetical protein